MYGQKFGGKLVKSLRSEIDNARKLRRIYFIGLDDEEYKEFFIF